MATGRNQLPASAQPKKGKSTPQKPSQPAKVSTKGAQPPGRRAAR